MTFSLAFPQFHDAKKVPLLLNHKDREATLAAYAKGEFTDARRRSWISIAGHVYARGEDASLLRTHVFVESKALCALCGDKCPLWRGDMDHIKGGNPKVRCDCFHRVLTDGTICTNIRWVHSMMDKEPCHRRKHHR